MKKAHSCSVVFSLFALFFVITAVLLAQTGNSTWVTLAGGIRAEPSATPLRFRSPPKGPDSKPAIVGGSSFVQPGLLKFQVLFRITSARRQITDNSTRSAVRAVERVLSRSTAVGCNLHGRRQMQERSLARLISAQRLLH